MILLPTNSCRQVRSLFDLPSFSHPVKTGQRVQVQEQEPANGIRNLMPFYSCECYFSLHGWLLVIFYQITRHVIIPGWPALLLVSEAHSPSNIASP